MTGDLVSYRVTCSNCLFCITLRVQDKWLDVTRVSEQTHAFKTSKQCPLPPPFQGPPKTKSRCTAAATERMLTSKLCSQRQKNFAEDINTRLKCFLSVKKYEKRTKVTESSCPTVEQGRKFTEDAFHSSFWNTWHNLRLVVRPQTRANASRGSCQAEWCCSPEKSTGVT